MDKPEAINLVDLIEKGPLYVTYDIRESGVQMSMSTSDWEKFPAIHLPCPCAGERVETTTYNPMVAKTIQFDHETFFGVMYVMYRCASCKKSLRFYFFSMALVSGYATPPASLATKIGQFPKLNVSIEKWLSKYLGEDNSQLLRKGILSRHQGHGLGSLVYLRRVIENLTERFRLEALKDNPNDTTLAELPKLRSFEERIDALSKFLPAVLFPQNHNPIKLFYGMASEGIHGGTEAHCVVLCDTLIPSFIQFCEQAVNADKSKTFGASIAALTSKKKG